MPLPPPRAHVAVRPLAFGHHLDQSQGVAWMKAALRRAAGTAAVPDPGSGPGQALDRALRVYDLVGRRSGVERRVTALADYAHEDWGRMDLFAAPAGGDGQAPAGTPGPWYRASLDARMALFAETAEALAQDAFAADAEPPDVLVQVSCTGYDSPSAAQRVVAERGWHGRTRVLSVGHMGCYAALPALATAADVVQATAARAAAASGPGDAEADARAAVLLVELCTLHHDPAATDPEQIVQQCLFADGAARVDVTARPPAPGTAGSATPTSATFALLDHGEAVVPDTLGEMTWRPADGGFRMTLSRAVPDHIRRHVAPVVARFLAQSGLAVEDVDVFAVHPGGPRVIESTAEALGLGDAVVRHSQAVLRDRGNMSSTTLPHIWAGIAADDAVPDGALVCSVAFGPGLTVAVNLMRKGA